MKRICKNAALAPGCVLVALLAAAAPAAAADEHGGEEHGFLADWVTGAGMGSFQGPRPYRVMRSETCGGEIVDAAVAGEFSAAFDKTTRDG